MNEEELIAESGILDDQQESRNADSVQQPKEKEEAQAPIEQEAEAPESFTKSEQEAYDVGWRPEDEYEGKGIWRDAETFLEISTLNSKVHDLNARDKKRNDDVDRKLEQQNVMHKFHMDALKKDYQAKVDAAVEEGDVAGVKTHQAQIDEINKQEAQMTPAPATPIDPELNHWMAQNPWLEKDESKRAVANAWLIEIENKNPHMGTKEQLNILDARLGAAYNETQAAPRQNPNRTAPSTNESRAQSGGRGSKRTEEPTMKTLSEEEKEEWRLLGTPIFGGNQKHFLEAVKNSRT